ncbi:MAG: hypothetical protein H7Z12_18105 [Rhodospirillaceae bacterium]|nr:hypothetical protein [Rhodospirillales bacterium]
MAVMAAAAVVAKVNMAAAAVVTALDAVPTHLEVAGKLGVDLWIQGLLTTLKVHVVVDLSAVAVVDGVHQVVLDVVEDKVAKTVAVLCLGVQLELLDLVKLGITLF